MCEFSERCQFDNFEILDVPPSQTPQSHYLKVAVDATNFIAPKGAINLQYIV